MFMETYQVVSEHSILSARRKDRDVAGKPRRSKHGREALQYRLKQIGATGESDLRHDVKATTQSDFKVYDRGRSKTELTDSRRKCRNRHHHAPTRRSGRIDEILEKLHKISEDFRSLKSEVLAESSKLDERRETEESEKENGIRGSSGFPSSVIAKSERAELNGDVEMTTTQVQSDDISPENWSEETVMEDSSSETPDGGTTFTEESPLIELGEINTSCVTVQCDMEKKDEDEGSSESRSWPLEKVKWDEEPSPAEPPPKEVLPEPLLSSELPPEENDEEVGFGCDTERVEKRIRVGWDPKLLDLMGFWTVAMGQAQYLLITPPQLTNTGGVFQEEKRGTEKMLGLLSPIIPSQAFQVHLPLLETHLINDHLLPPTHANKRLEELSLATFLLGVKDGNGLSYINSFQLLLKGVTELIKWLVEFGFGQLIINIPILVMHPLVHKWDPGGLKQDEESGSLRILMCSSNNEVLEKKEGIYKEGSREAENEAKWALRGLDIYLTLVSHAQHGEQVCLMVILAIMDLEKMILDGIINGLILLSPIQNLINPRKNIKDVAHGFLVTVIADPLLLPKYFEIRATFTTCVWLSKHLGCLTKEETSTSGSVLEEHQSFYSNIYCKALEPAIDCDWISVDAENNVHPDPHIQLPFVGLDAIGVCLVEVAVSLFHSRWKGFLENYLVSNDMYSLVTKAKEPLLTVLSNLIFLNNIFMRTTCGDVVVLPNGKEMQVQVYVVESYVDGNDFSATTLIEICTKYEQESISEYESVAAAVMCWHLSISIRQWDPGQLTCPMTAIAYGYHWNVFFDFLQLLSFLFDRGSLPVSCIAWSSCFMLWDPGGRLLLRLGYRCLIQQMKVLELSQVMLEDMEDLTKGKQHPTREPMESLRNLLKSHLEDKVNFEGGGVDTDLIIKGQKVKMGLMQIFCNEGQKGKIIKVSHYSDVTNYCHVGSSHVGRVGIFCQLEGREWI